MATKLTSSGTVAVKNVGKDPLGDSLAVAVKLTAKKTTNGITFLFTATENTLRDLKTVLGPQVSIAKPARALLSMFRVQRTLGFRSDYR